MRDITQSFSIDGSAGGSNGIVAVSVPAPATFFLFLGSLFVLCWRGAQLALGVRAEQWGTFACGFQGVYRDISERKRADEALRESEERYRLMFQEAEDARAVLEKSGAGEPGVIGWLGAAALAMGNLVLLRMGF